ncbi:MAG TPA: aminotransferase class I/II-fold pyridoxal phosphate-dependent enzyme, partial [Bacteroidales bacterium]|nr:aminotransferase class I/II-fold pyridoxal phosphate-dependent enzyme [Bacteroidales bacterium]
NHSRTFIYTTALPPINIAWTRFIMQQLPYFQKQRKNLQLLAQEFSKLLQVPATSHIIPYIIGENDKAISIAEELQTQGFFVLPIRYPTVAKHTARLRFSLHANISHNELRTIATFLSKKA